MGWLRRELRALGERLLFDTDPGDPRPELALRGFFGRLRGLAPCAARSPSTPTAFANCRPVDSAIAFEIEMARPTRSTTCA